MRSWSSLNNIGSSRIVRSSFLWIVVVPIIARALQSIESPLLFQVFGQEIKLNFDLPFSWILFYFGALAFAAATGLYITRAPRIVREFRHYTDYRGTGRRIADIANFFHVDYCSDIALLNRDAALDESVQQDLGIKRIAIIRPDVVPNTLQTVTRMIAGDIGDEKFNRLDQFSGDDKVEPAVFWAVFNSANSSRIRSRLLCASLYLIGFVLMGIVFAQNFYYVIVQTVI